MADTGKIYITISDTRGGSGNGVSNSSDTGYQSGSSGAASSSGSSSESAFKIIAKTQFANFVINQTKSVVAYAIGNIGNFTGDYVAQHNIQTGLQHISIIGNIVNAYKEGGILGGIIATASPFAADLMRMNREIIQNKKVNREIDMIRQRSGLNTLKDGSRGTED